MYVAHGVANADRIETPMRIDSAAMVSDRNRQIIERRRSGEPGSPANPEARRTREKHPAETNQSFRRGSVQTASTTKHENPQVHAGDCRGRNSLQRTVLIHAEIDWDQTAAISQRKELSSMHAVVG